MTTPQVSTCHRSCIIAPLAHMSQTGMPGRTAASAGFDHLLDQFEPISRHSDFVRQMRAMAIHSTGFSKYCIGTALLYPGVKHNNFKDKLRLVEKLIGDDDHVYGSH